MLDKFYMNDKYFARLLDNHYSHDFGQEAYRAFLNKFYKGITLCVHQKALTSGDLLKEAIDNKGVEFLGEAELFFHSEMFYPEVKRFSPLLRREFMDKNADYFKLFQQDKIHFLFKKQESNKFTVHIRLFKKSKFREFVENESRMFCSHSEYESIVQNSMELVYQEEERDAQLRMGYRIEQLDEPIWDLYNVTQGIIR